MPTVEFLNAGKKIECGKFANLRKVAILNDVEVYKGPNQVTNCMGNGLCGTCFVEVVEGAENLSAPNRREVRALKGKPANYRLSCQCQVAGDISVITAAALD
jgi:ferredoxin